ncbi:MAG: hypothetical protein LHV69_03205 [Elusimicrobia bacterium]|nr:hypothetical protein [Candidatus Obscuribacterium magneticum]
MQNAVIPAKAGIQSGVHVLDSGFRRNDVFYDKLDVIARPPRRASVHGCYDTLNDSEVLSV